MKYSEEIEQEQRKICLNCPYPQCEEDKGNTANICEYYKAEAKKIVEKYRKEKGK